jgi:hypothetical protein
MNYARDMALPLRSLALLLTMGCASNHSLKPETGGALSSADLCVTEGRIEASEVGMAVNVAKMRAYTKRLGSDSAELRFTYVGPTEVHEVLGSGEMREQLGLKLRAEDACNLIYVMWRIQPTAELVVSVKSNPGVHSSSECTNHGYRDIRPNTSSAVQPLKPGSAHRLLAVVRAAQLTVFVDETIAWQGLLDNTAARLRGPAGVRSDNSRFRFELAVGPGEDRVACPSGHQDSD